MKALYELFKPGIIYGNALPFVAAYVLATGFSRPLTFAMALLGQSLVIGGACALNNVLDRGIDARMARTKTRALVTGKLSVTAATSVGLIVAAIGLCLLAWISWLVFYIGAAGLILYVLVYGYTKRRGPFGTVVGSIPGALPPVAGYAAGAGQLDVTAVLLFVVLVAWQMPHFYAIAIYRQKDYAAAGLPVLPIVRGLSRTKRTIFGYQVLFWIALIGLTVSTQLGMSYAVIAAGLGGWWLLVSLTNQALPAPAWARKVFLRSLITLTVACATIALGRYLP